MEKNEIIEDAVKRFDSHLKQGLAKSLPEQRRVLARYSAAISDFDYWLALSAEAVRSDEARKIIQDNLEVERANDHAGLRARFMESAGIRTSSADIRQSVKDLYYLGGDIFDRGYATALRKVAALAVMENASGSFIPVLEKYAVNLGGRDLGYTKVHGVADKEHAVELVKALNLEVKAQMKAGHDKGFCDSAVKLGANITAEFLVNILNPNPQRYISFI